MTLPRKTLFLLPLLLIIASCGRKPEAPPPPPPGVVCALSETRPVSSTHEFIGQIVAEDSVNLVARVEGYLIKRNFEEGSMVKQGDLIFEIDPRPFEADVKEAQGQLERAKAQLTYADIQVNRYTTLVKGDAVSQKELDSATMDQGSSRGDILIAQGKLDLAKINLEYTRITAPFDGKIGTCPVSVGNLVGPTINSNLSTIVRLDPVKVEFSVPEPVVTNLRQKFGSIDKIISEIIIRMNLSNGTRYPEEGRIYFSDNTINTATGTLLVRARFKNNGVISAGEYVKVILEEKTPVPSILVPAIAVQKDQTGEYVLILDKDSKVQRKIIRTGQAHGMDIVVLQGLSEGERVIVQGVLKVRPGMTANAEAKDARKPSTQAPAAK